MSLFKVSENRKHVFLNKEMMSFHVSNGEIFISDFCLVANYLQCHDMK